MNDNSQLLDEDAFRMVAAMLEERYGLHFHGGNRDILDVGLGRVAADKGFSVPELVRMLTSPSDELLQQIVQAVTICETYFFRHPEHFTLLTEHVVPRLLRNSKKRLRAWSAGCATGEEAYSLAMALLTYAPGLELQVLGTDINQAALRTAERARYGQHSLRVPSLLLDAYLWPQPGGDFMVSPEVQRLVSFQRLNLRDPLFQLQFVANEAFDIIFCRNVLVYFAPALVPQILNRLRDCLNEGGYLCLSALDCTAQISGLEPMAGGGMNFLRRVLPSRGTPTEAVPSRLTPSVISQAVPVRRSGQDHSGPVAVTPSINNAITSAFSAARAAADKGQLDRADAIARDALTQRRTPEALHLLALIRGERGQAKEMEALLLEAVEANPGYVLGHLSLGLMDRPRQERWRSAHHLNRVMGLLRTRRDEETLQGPECLQVAMARRLALAGLENLERRP